MPDPWNDSVFVIEPEIRNYRYLFSDGNIMDVSSPYQANSTDREKVLIEANRRWGKVSDGKNSDGRKISGVTQLPVVEASDD